MDASAFALAEEGVPNIKGMKNVELSRGKMRLS
jgi:hypothetical protein